MAEHEEILDSWKEIADYLRKDTRTCQRYERELGLPVHRLDGSPKARVFAYRRELDAWRARTVDEHAQRRSRLRRSLLAAGAVVASAAALLVWGPGSRYEGPPVLSSDRPSVAILNLANRTGEESLDQYREVLPSMISYDLSQSKYLYVVPDDQVNSILTRLGLLEKEAYTREDLRTIGRRGVTKYVASGFYLKAGERFLVRLTVQEAESGEVVGGAEVQSKSLESLFAHGIDELTLKVKPLLELAAVEIANDIDGRLDRVTTSSIEAYKHYLQGSKLAAAASPREAVAAYEKATAIDPEFAMAYRRLSAQYAILGDSVRGVSAAAKAKEIARRREDLPVRERLLIESQDTDHDGTVKGLSCLLEIYPEEVTGNINLGFYYDVHLDEPGRAVELTSVPVRNKVESFLPFSRLAGQLCRLGRYPDAERVLKEFLREFPGNPGVAGAVRTLAQVHMTEGKFEAALEDLEKALRLDPQPAREVARIRGKVLALIGDFKNAEAELNGLLAEKEAPDIFYVHQDLARLNMAQGRFRKAEEDYSEALAAAKTNNLNYRVFELLEKLFFKHLSIGAIDRAEADHEEIRAFVKEEGYNPDESSYLIYKAETLSRRRAFAEAARYAAAFLALREKRPNKRSISAPLRAQGIIELERGDFAKAIDLLTRAKSLLWFETWDAVIPRTREFHAFYMEPLALAYLRTGDLEKARQEYEAITRLTTGRLAYGDIYARSFYRLGQIYEQMGRKKPARANYRKFLELWKNADPGIPEVEDAKKRLAAL